jgi:hypothetical protein
MDSEVSAAITVYVITTIILIINKECRDSTVKPVTEKVTTGEVIIIQTPRCRDSKSTKTASTSNSNNSKFSNRTIK